MKKLSITTFLIQLYLLIRKEFLNKSLKSLLRFIKGINIRLKSLVDTWNNFATNLTLLAFFLQINKKLDDVTN